MMIEQIGLHYAVIRNCLITLMITDRVATPSKGIQELLLVKSEILALESGIQREESGIPSSTDKESGIQYLASGIHDVESTIQDCLGFTYIGRELDSIQSYYHFDAVASNRLD